MNGVNFQGIVVYVKPLFPPSSSCFWLNTLIQNIETGETISTSALDNLGWDCPKKTTTTSTTTTAIYSGCDKDAFERDSNTTLTCTNDNVSLIYRIKWFI